MPFRLGRRAYEAGALLVAIAVLVAMGALAAGASGLLLPSGHAIFGDFLAFWSAGKLALAGDAERVHDIAAIRQQHALAVPGVRHVAPWNSPPTFLLIASALATMPFAIAALIFLAVSGALYLFVARKLLPDACALLFATTAPAALYHIGSVQTGLLIAGLNGLAAYWLDRRPLAAGIAIGLLAIKPHLAIVWPLLLVLSGRWRAFGAAAIGGGVFVLAGGVAFGFESYPRFFDNLATAQALIDPARVARETFASLYGNLRGLGIASAPALALHYASALVALALAVLIFRRGETRVQVAALCAATMLFSPYLFFYDATLLALGAALLGAPRDRVETIVFVLAWGAGLSLVIGYAVSLPLCPLVGWALLLTAARRAGITFSGNAAARPAPGSRT